MIGIQSSKCWDSVEQLLGKSKLLGKYELLGESDMLVHCFKFCFVNIVIALSKVNYRVSSLKDQVCLTWLAKFNIWGL